MDIQPEPGIDTHVLVCDPYKGKEREHISPPVLHQELVASEDKHCDCDVVAEAEFARKEIEKLTLQQAGSVFALPFAIVARFAKDFDIVRRFKNAIT